jgi:hypothetical protein
MEGKGCGGICFMLVWWGGWIAGGSILVSDGGVYFNNWISTSCVATGFNVKQTSSGKTKRYACDLSVAYADGVLGTVRAKSSTSKSSAQSTCDSYVNSSAFPCVYPSQHPANGYLTKADAAGALLTSFIIGTILLLVCVGCPIGFVVFQICKNVGDFDCDCDLSWTRGSISNSYQPSTHLDQIVLTEVPKAEYAAEDSDEGPVPNDLTELREAGDEAALIEAFENLAQRAKMGDASVTKQQVIAEANLKRTTMEGSWTAAVGRQYGLLLQTL